jgi:polysaccharide export outer membrane protein
MLLIRARLLAAIILAATLRGAYQTDLPLMPLGPGDVIEVTIEGESDLTKRLTVSQKGEIEMPLLKAPLQVNRMAPADAETLIADAYKTQRLLLQPFVHVVPVEYHSYLVKVTGAVVHPLEFQALDPVTLLSTIARAGGPTTSAAGEIEVTVHDREAGKETKQIISIRKLIEDPDPKYNPLLKGGEDVYLPAALPPAK